MIDPMTAMGAVTLNVAKLDPMLAFYRDVVGLTVREQHDGSATMGTTEQALVHLRQHTGDRSSPPSCGLYHLALRVPSNAALADRFHHYAACEAPHWQGASDHGVSHALYLNDPEGNGIEVYCDRARSDWEVAADGTVTVYARSLDLRTLLWIGPGTEWNGIDAATDMGHIHLKVADISTAKRFYAEMLGFQVKTELPGSALFVAAGDYHHHLGFNTWHSRGAPPAPENGLGLAHFELQFPHELGRQAALQRLAVSGYAVQMDGTTARVRDPFGIAVELVIPRSGSGTLPLLS